MNCPNCNKTLSDSAIFCSGCGTRVKAADSVGQESGNISPSDAKIGQIESTGFPTEAPAPLAADIKKKRSKKPLIFGGVGLVVALALALTAVLVPFGQKKSNKFQNNYAVYLKNSGLYFSDLKSDSEPVLLTPFETGANETDIRYATCMSDNGRYVFFPQNSNNDCFDLYYKDTTKPNQDARLIESFVNCYTVNSSSNLVTYTVKFKDNETLCQYRLDNDTKQSIADDIGKFDVTDDGKKFVYLSNGELYTKQENRPAEKIADGCLDIKHATGDLCTVYYTDSNGCLYKMTESGKKTEQILSDWSMMLNIYDSGEMYFTRSRKEDVSVLDYIDVTSSSLKKD